MQVIKSLFSYPVILFLKDIKNIFSTVHVSMEIFKKLHNLPALSENQYFDELNFLTKNFYLKKKNIYIILVIVKKNASGPLENRWPNRQRSASVDPGGPLADR